MADAGDLDAEYEAWLRGVLDRQRWSYSRGYWRAEAESVAATAGGNKPAMAVCKERRPTLSVRAACTDGGGDVGLILDFRGESDFDIVKVDAAGRVIGSRCAGGQWTQTFRTAAGTVADRGGFTLTLNIADGEARVDVDGREVARRPVGDAGREGYWVAGASGRFTPLPDAPPGP